MRDVYIICLCKGRVFWEGGRAGLKALVSPHELGVQHKKGM